MNEIMSTATVIILLVAAFAGLVVWVRRDTFTGEQYREPTRPERSVSHARSTTSAPSVRAGVLRLS